MRVEIERKFLVLNDAWRLHAIGACRLRDGLIGQFETGKVRVRLDDNRAWLTVKGPRIGLGRAEFEYEIPRADGEIMIGTVCPGCLIEKTRFRVPHEGHVWEVDVYDEPAPGLVLAEIELDFEEEVFARPSWLGAEVTQDHRFRQSNLLRISVDAGRPVTLDDILGRRAAPAALLRAS